MEKNILVVIEGVPTFNIAVKKEETIGQIKKVLKQYDDYSIKMLLNSTNELKVFETDEYDNMTLETAWNKMKKSKIILTKKQKMNIDVFLEIAKRSDNRTILNMLATNKEFDKEKNYKDILFRKYPNLVKYKNETSWKKYFLNIVYYIGKLEEDFNYNYQNSAKIADKTPENIYRWYALLKKFDQWRNVEVDYFEIYNAFNIYDLLYNPIGNGNHDTLSSYLINESSIANFNETTDDFSEELQKFTPRGIFGEETALFELTGDLEPVDKIEEYGEYVPYDYNYLLYILKKNGKTIKDYEKVLGKSSDYIKIYPKLYAEKLGSKPISRNLSFLHDNIRRKTNALINSLSEDNEEINKDDLYLTEEEISLILSLHLKVLDSELSILTEVTPENLA